MRENWRYLEDVETIIKTDTLKPRNKDEINTAPSEPDGPVIVSIDDFLNRKLAPRELLLSPWLPRQGLAMIHAPRGIGKTHVSLGVAYAVATGGSFLSWQAPSPGGVLLLDGEMPAPALQERLAAIVYTNGIEPSAPFNLLTPDMQPKDRTAFNIGFLDDQDALEPYLEDVSLIVVDNIATLCRTGKENDAESWMPIQEWALRQRANGRSVLFIHHSGKGGQQRGTSSREDVLDTVINLKRPSDYEAHQGARFEIHFEKARGFYGEDSQPLEAALIVNEHGKQVWTAMPLEDSVYEQVITLHQDGLNQRQISEEIGRDKSRVSRMLKRARQEGRIHD
ncbi:MAG: AAA family ATPase [Gammaproteobacteria bacterium]|nr:AAA family ATPase [Gammaproteobacteria bacterium]